MTFHYLDYLLLDVFSIEEFRKPKSLYYILTGKRTVSVMLQALRNGISCYFSLFPKLNWASFSKELKKFEEEEMLITQENGMRLTQKGQKACERFFQNHTRITSEKQLRYVRVLSDFQNKSLFTVQVFSHLSHQNTQYYPLLEGMEEQIWVKEFLKSLKSLEKDRSALAQQYGKEWLSLLKNSFLKEKTIFLAQFEGYQCIRKTARQAAAEFGKEEAEIRMIWHQGWLHILALLEKDGKDYPISVQLFRQITNSGALCSVSAQETWRLLNEGINWNEVADYRSLKQSTINDHITEWAILDPEFPFESFLSPGQIDYVKKRQVEQIPVEYSEIQAEFPGLSFFENRLIQVMSEVHKKDDRTIFTS